jgi:hypothetical protein
MPAGSRMVDAYTAYTGSSRHRRASYLVTSDGAERKEVAGRRPLGDVRPVREADVWANVEHNLARQAEAPSALGFLERARLVQQEVAEALQQGMQPLEQREAEGRRRATLGQTFRRQRIAAQVARLVEPLRGLAQGQAERLAGLGQAVSATWRCPGGDRARDPVDHPAGRGTTRRRSRADPAAEDRRAAAGRARSDPRPLAASGTCQRL